LGLLLRGEIVWIKGKGAGNSTAWGSFQSPTNPVLRDLTERIIIASKGRFDRAISRRDRASRDLPSEVSIFKDEFMEATTDVWEIAPESAHRVNHPAPFPVELPQRLIELYTYRGDLILDPFMGSGSTAVAAIRTDRHFVGYEIDTSYREVARKRIEDERARLRNLSAHQKRKVVLPAVPKASDASEDFQARGVREGRAAKEIARALLEAAGFSDIQADQRVAGGVEINFAARDASSRLWLFDVSGAFTSTRGGLRRTDTLWKALGKAGVLRASDVDDYRLVLLTTDLPATGSTGENALRTARAGGLFHAAVEMLAPDAQATLAVWASGDTATVTGALPPAED
jgi:site-specific DNA-methyltransferase (adenine-specific)